MLLKADGSISLKNHPVMRQLYQLRTIMEKMRPLDKRLQHQMDRLVNSALEEDEEKQEDKEEEEGETDEEDLEGKDKKKKKKNFIKNKKEGKDAEDPLQYRPVLDDSDSEEEDSDDKEEEDQKGTQKKKKDTKQKNLESKQQQEQEQQQQIYKAPRMNPIMLQSEADKKAKKKGRTLEKLRRSEILQTLRQEVDRYIYTDTDSYLLLYYIDVFVYYYVLL